MKRQDIQLLRAFAVTSVLLFHMSPKMFPNGKFGVDIFFVISGFLICSVLSQDRKQTVVCWLCQFYFRRRKRIVPLAYFVFAISFLTMYKLGLTNFFTINQASGYKALFFVGNMKLTVEDDYGNQIAESTVLLTHYWSLAVEIQFYLTAPSIIAATWKQPAISKFIFTTILLSLSILHFLSSSTTISFNCPFARLWQFLAGFLAFYGSAPNNIVAVVDKEISEDAEASPLMNAIVEANDAEDMSVVSQRTSKLKRTGRYFLTTVCWAMVGVIFARHGIPFEEGEVLMQLLVTTATAWIIGSQTTLLLGSSIKQKESPQPESTFLKPFWFIGDISYVLYLVHWPILCFIRHYSTTIPFLGKNAVIVYLLSAFVAAIILHYLFEAPLLSYGNTPNALAIVLLFVFCASLTRQNVFNTLSGDKFFEFAIEQNKKNIERMFEHNKTFAASFYLHDIRHQISKFPNGDGNLSFLVIGNSFCTNQADVIYHHVKRIAKNVSLVCDADCESLVDTRNISRCNETNFTRIVEYVKPDILLVVERGIAIKEEVNTVDLMEDKLMKRIHERVMRWEKSSKKIYILGAIPNLVKFPVTTAIGYLLKKQRLRDSKSLVIHDNFYQKRRLSQILRFCRKCEILKWEQSFYDDQSVFRTFNKETDVMLFDNNLLLNKEGIEYISPVYSELSTQLKNLTIS